MKKLSFCLVFFLAYFCIPYKIAPKIDGELIIKAKKFKKDLPNFYGFIFEDTKNADEFYNFINTKYNLKNINVDSNVPIRIYNKTYYLSFFERERSTATINLVPFVIDAHRTSKGKDPILENLHTSRKGFWYLVLTVTDSNFKDCLNPNYPQNGEIVNHLKKLKSEYFSTNNYFEAYFKMK